LIAYAFANVGHAGTQQRTLPGAFSPAGGLESPPAERFDPSSAVLHQGNNPHRALASRRRDTSDRHQSCSMSIAFPHG
jgi:hypothetical protein